MEFEDWHQWSGKEVASFVSQFCGLPQYATAIGQNLSGLTLKQLAAAGFLSKGLSRAGICDYEHQQQIAQDVLWLLQRSPDEVREEMKVRISVEASRKAAPKKLALLIAPKGKAPGRRRPGPGPKVAIPAASVVELRSPTSPLAEAGMRIARQSEQAATRNTPRPYSDEPTLAASVAVAAGLDAEEAPELTSAQKLRGKLATSNHEYEDMRGPQPWAVYGVRGLKELQAQQVQQAQEEAAAAKIQAIQRGKQGRRDVEAKRKKDFEIRSQRELAATRIQAISRGKKSRASVDQGKAEQGAAAAKIQAVHRGKAARRDLEKQGTIDAYNDFKASQDQARSKDAAEFGAYSNEQEAAIAKIQAVQRGKADRKEVKRAQQETAAQSQAVQACEPSSTIALAGTAEEQAAATRIQSIHRGKQARAEVSGLRTGNQQLPTDDAEHGEYDDEQQAAIAKIQAVQRGKQARKDVEAIKEENREQREQEAAATRIQAIQRGKAARRQLSQPDEENAENVPAEATALAGSEEEQAAATRIQAIQRGKAARRELANPGEENPQEMLAGNIGIEGTDQEQAAATRIQAIQRGKQSRKEVDALRAVGAASGAEVEWDEQQEAAALKIQAIQRGKQGRQEVEAKRADIVQHQEEEAAATKIQAIQRGKASRRQQSEQGVDVGADEEVGKPPSEGADEEQAAAALRIQAMQRGKQARKEVETMRVEHEQQVAAATKIQAVTRGKAARKSTGEQGDAK